MEGYLRFNCADSVKKITVYIREVTRKTGIDRLVIGLSGGVDSATSAMLAVKAVEAGNIFPVILPYGTLHQQSEKDAQKIVEHLEIPQGNIFRIDIQPLVDQFIAQDQSTDTIRKGNIMARVRMIYLFDQAKKRNALVLGTENRTEHLLGYFTRFGDSASDIEPIIHLYKTQVRRLATFLGVKREIIEKVPTAGLWEGQTDEAEFGFTYEEADRILSLFVDCKETKEEIVKKRFSSGIVEKVITRFETNKYKHETPYTLFPL